MEERYRGRDQRVHYSRMPLLTISDSLVDIDVNISYLPYAFRNLQWIVFYVNNLNILFTHYSKGCLFIEMRSD